MLVERAYTFNPDRKIQLASGEQSSEYIDCKSALAEPAALAAVPELFYPRLKSEVTAVGGLTMGADPIAISIGLYSQLRGHRPIRWFTVRKETKGHGLQKLIEGNLPPGSKVAIVDDVVTWGTSTADAIDKCQQAGHSVVQVLVLVDREQGGLEKIKNRLDHTVPVEAIFRKSEIKALWQARHQSNPGSRAAM